METAIDDLPEGIEALRAALLAERIRIRDLESANVRLTDQVDQLELLAEQLRRLVEQFRQLKFGKSSEKLDPNQLKLAFEDVEQAIAEVQAKEDKLRPELRAKRTGERRQTRPSLPECAGAASGCVLLPGIPHLGLEQRAAWAETKPDGTVTPRWTVGSAWIRSAIPTPRLWRCC